MENAIYLAYKKTLRSLAISSLEATNATRKIQRNLQTLRNDRRRLIRETYYVHRWRTKHYKVVSLSKLNVFETFFQMII